MASFPAELVGWRHIWFHAEDDWERGWVRALVWPSSLKPCGGCVFQPQSQVLEFNSSVTKPIGMLLPVGIFSFVRFLMLCAWPHLPFVLWSLAKGDSSAEFLEAFFFAATAFITAVLFDSLLFFFYIIMHSLNISRSPLAQEWILAIRKFPHIACDLLLPDLGTVSNEPRDWKS